MAWVAVDADGSEWIYLHFPQKFDDGFWESDSDTIRLPDGWIEKMIGRKLTWQDEPVELK